MPIYEYACQKCGEEFEVQQRITDEPLTEHEGCGGPVKKLISLTSFSLKGDGWYSDHYGLKNGNGKQDDDSKGTSKESGETSTASEKASTSSDKKANESKTKETKSATSAAAGTDKKSSSSDKVA